MIIAILALLGNTLAALLLGAVGSSCAMVLRYPEVAIEQPRNLVDGHFIFTPNIATPN